MDVANFLFTLLFLPIILLGRIDDMISRLGATATGRRVKTKPQEERKDGDGNGGTDGDEGGDMFNRI